MYKRILLAHEGSLEYRRALHHGVDLAQRFDAEVLLLAIIRSSAGLPMAGGVNPSGVVEAEQDECKKALEEGLERLKARGIEAKTALGYGDPVEEINRHAREFGADLVVVGYKRRGNFERWWQRSIGRSLLNDLPCSLLISTPQGDGED